MRRIKAIFSKQNRALLAELVRTDFKLRYQGSVLGYAWSLLRPLLLFTILYIVFVKFLKIGNGVPHYPVYLLLGIIMWNFFLELTVQGLASVVGRGDLIRKIRIPRWIIVLSSSIGALINVLLNFIVLAVIMVINHVDVTSSIALLPVLVIEVYLFALGISLFLSAAFVKYRDVSYIWEVVLQAGFYFTPILYPLTLISNLTLKKIILLNPMAQAVQDARYSLVTHHEPTVWRIFDHGPYAYIPVAIVVVVLIVGVLYFKSQADTFAENI